MKHVDASQASLFPLELFPESLMSEQASGAEKAPQNTKSSISSRHKAVQPEPLRQIASNKTQEAFKTISEVADMLALPQYVLRFWESQFKQIKPTKLRGGRRYYRPEDIATLQTIKHLLYKEGYTIKGARLAFDEYKKQVDAAKYDAAQPGRKHANRNKRKKRDAPLLQPSKPAEIKVSMHSLAEQKLAEKKALLANLRDELLALKEQLVMA